MNLGSGAQHSDSKVREKLVNQGAKTLTDSELLSIVLGKSTSTESSLDLAERLLTEFDGSLSKLAQCDLKRLRSTQSLGISRAATVSAALELGKRLRADGTVVKDMIENEHDVIEMFQPMLGPLRHEEFWVIYLNASNRILDKVRISQGGVNGSVVDHKLIVKRAVEYLANGIIIVHNHPSGSSQPGEDDKVSTEKIARAASLFDITLADHIIITEGECYSFRNAGFFAEIPITF